MKKNEPSEVWVTFTNEKNTRPSICRVDRDNWECTKFVRAGTEKDNVITELKEYIRTLDKKYVKFHSGMILRKLEDMEK